MTPSTAGPHDRIQKSFDLQRFMASLGAELVQVAEGEVQIAFPFSDRLSQQRGYIHAGALTSIVDSACGYAALTMAPADCEVVSAEFKVNFLRPAIGERFVATGTVVNSGRLLTVCKGEVRAESGGVSKIVAVMQATMVIVSRPA